MILIVGLGNPGRKYKKTRHNVGWRVIDEIIKSQKSKVKSQKLLLLKPQTFMNQSGKAVESLTTKYKIPTTNVIVIHDDIDLSFGTIRISKNISSAGHKGVQSIINELGTQNFTRVRIGIRPPLLRQGFGGRAQNFVLGKFTKDEKKQLKQIIRQAVSEITQLI